jgi:hypothetical protein
MIDMSVLMPIAIGFLGVICAALGWFANQIWNGLKRNETDLAAHKLAVAENYVRHDRLQEMFRPLNSSLADIQIMLARKADRSDR